METTNWKKIIHVAIRNKIYVILIMLLTIILGIIYTFLGVKEKYKSSATFILGTQTAISGETNELENKAPILRTSIKLDSQTISTYSELAKSNASIKKIKDNLKLDISDQKLKDAIKFKRVNKSDLIKITAEYSDKKIAKNIVDETVKIFSEKVKEIYQFSEIYIIDSAFVSEEPYNINHLRDIIIFIFLGVLLNLIYCIVIAKMDKTIKSSEMIEDVGLKVLISIPNKKTKKQLLEKLINFQKEKSPILEAFKTLRTNVQFTNISNKNNKVMLITSCLSSEGKSYVAANLAAMFANAGKKVILIDTDMRARRQASIFGIPNNLGISNYLANLDLNGMEINQRINSYIRETSIKNLNVITSGSIPPNSSELLSSEKMPELIKDLSVFYDFVILDGPPVLPVEDSLILSKISGSTILVTLADKTKKEDLLKAKMDLENAKSKIIGVVLNQASSNNKIEKKAYIKLELKKIKEKREKNNKTNNFKIKVSKMKKWILKHITKRKILLLEQRKDDVEKIIKDENIKKHDENFQSVDIDKKAIKKEDISEEYVENIVRSNDVESENKEINNKEINNKEINNKEINNKEINNKEISNKEIDIESSRKKYNKYFKLVLEKISEKSKIFVNNIKTYFKNSKETIKEFYINTKQKNAIKRQEKIKQKELNLEITEQLKQQIIDENINNTEIMEDEKNGEKTNLEEEQVEIKVENEIKTEKKSFREELKNKKIQKRKEKRRRRQEEREKQKQEAKINEELLEDNLYPKTKFNKNL